MPGITIGSIGVPLATAGGAGCRAATDAPAVTGVITGPRTFVPKTGEVIVVGETLLPERAGLSGQRPGTAVTTKGVTPSTRHVLPLSRSGKVTTFTVVPPVP